MVTRWKMNKYPKIYIEREICIVGIFVNKYMSDVYIEIHNKGNTYLNKDRTICKSIMYLLDCFNNLMETVKFISFSEEHREKSREIKNDRDPWLFYIKLNMYVVDIQG